MSFEAYHNSRRRRALIGGSGSAASAYLGQVATRTLIPKSLNTSNKQIQSRRYVFARDNISSLQIVIPNWYVNSGVNGAETNQGGTLTVTASIEYPAGTFTQVKFSGSASSVIADGGMLVSDAVAVSIPNGAKFYIRLFGQASNGIIFTTASLALDDTANGDACQFAPSGISDLTMGGTIPNAGTGIMFTVAAVIAMTKKGSVFLMGDSRVVGTNDLVSDTSGDSGELARAIGPLFAYINGGVAGDRATWAAASYVNRTTLAGYCSAIACNFGVNDLSAGRSAAQLSTDIQTLRALFPSKPFFKSTIPPKTGSTDGWSSLVNQATSIPARITHNDALRAGSIPGITGYFEIANVVESSLNSGTWREDTVRTVSDFAISATSLSSATAAFTSADQFKAVAVAGAGAAGAYLTANILTVVNSTTVTLDVAAGTTVSAAVGAIGTPSIDGLHEANPMYQAIRDSGNINTAVFHR